jgi:hypothetical protein
VHRKGSSTAAQHMMPNLADMSEIEAADNLQNVLWWHHWDCKNTVSRCLNLELAGRHTLCLYTLHLVETRQQMRHQTEQPWHCC